VTKINVTLSGLSKSFSSARELLTTISQIREAQSIRQARLSSAKKMSSYAKSKGISTSEMSSLTKGNFSRNRRNLEKLESIANTKDFQERLKAEKLKAKSLFKNSKDLSSRSAGGGRTAAAIDSQRGGLSKSLLSKKLMPKT